MLQNLTTSQNEMAREVASASRKHDEKLAHLEETVKRAERLGQRMAAAREEGDKGRKERSTAGGAIEVDEEQSDSEPEYHELRQPPSPKRKSSRVNSFYVSPPAALKAGQS